MINKIKENNTLYIRKCKHCKSIFSYDAQDYVSSYGYSDSYGNVKCPYCSSRNKIKFKIRYKSSKKVNQDYKTELNIIREENNNLKVKIEKLELENNNLKETTGNYDNIKSLYESEKKKCSNYLSAYNKENDKIRKVDDYIEDYMNSSRKNNLATKYLKEIQEIIK